MIYSNETAKTTAELLLQIKAIKLNLQTPYTWASGWQSPIYTDNRITLSYPEIRTYIKEQFSEIVKAKFNDADLIAGVATAGIAHGALLADMLNMPYCYVRSEPKKHGLSNMIEGRVIEGQKVVVIEDLISTGGSSLNVVNALRAVGCEVLGLIAIFTYGFDVSRDRFESADCPFYTLTDYNHLIKAAIKNNSIMQEDEMILQSWRAKPDSWTKSL